MRKSVSVVLGNGDDIHEIFGANDSNVALIEELLGVKIFIRGNEIFLDTEDEGKRTVFRHLIDQLEECVKLGQPPESDLIRAIYKSLDRGERENAEFLKNTRIIIPHSSVKVFPKTFNQALYIDAIESQDIVFGVGPAGTGKTFLAVALALKYILNHSKRKLIVTRPVIEAGESLGFLPGDYTQKINPYLRPIYDAIMSLVSPETLKKLEENNTLEIAPLAYMRGRTLSDAVIILDEAQNTSREQMKMLLTRIGNRTKTVITGDITQIDLPEKGRSGLLHAISLMQSIQEIRFLFFNDQDVVRHPLVRKIVKAYESETKE